MIATWERAWPDFTPFLEFPIELRTIVYTANAIESLNAGPVSRSATAATSRPSRQR
jgi:transposase-like protein